MSRATVTSPVTTHTLPQARGRPRRPPRAGLYRGIAEGLQNECRGRYSSLLRPARWPLSTSASRRCRSGEDAPRVSAAPLVCCDCLRARRPPRSKGPCTIENAQRRGGAVKTGDTLFINRTDDIDGARPELKYLRYCEKRPDLYITGDIKRGARAPAPRHQQDRPHADARRHRGRQAQALHVQDSREVNPAQPRVSARVDGAGEARAAQVCARRVLTETSRAQRRARASGSRSARTTRSTT